MRNELAKQLQILFEREAFAFMTGDLGYAAFEGLELKLGKYFINAGIAEQNMLSMAAGLVLENLNCWVYSIAPFIYARPFEQIRNDISFHNLPVFIVGNGGGFAYGVMGDTHHAIEDYGVILTLGNFRAYIPSFDSDIADIISLMQERKQPTYLRLGYDEAPNQFNRPAYAPWRIISEGGGGIILVVGPIIGSIINLVQEMSYEVRPELWLVSELPLDPNSVPAQFWSKLNSNRSLLVVEEHVEQGSFARMLALELLRRKIQPKSFDSLHAARNTNGHSGSQGYYRKLNKLDASSILEISAHLEK